MKLNLKNKFSEELPADSIRENSRRQVKEACFSYVTPKQTKNPLEIVLLRVSSISFLNREAYSSYFLLET